MHQFQCNKCQQIHYKYHSCGNRHCPNCGGMKREQWIEDRMSELLPTKYFHIVFTVPQELRSLCMGNRTILFNLLFECAHYTLIKLSKDPKYLGATPGIISILHTNGQDLSFHPHVHCIISGGGIEVNGLWVKEKRENGFFLFPRRAMEKIFKARMLLRIKKLIRANKIAIQDKIETKAMLHAIGFKKWNVYAKSPFGGPAQIIEYLGRYTHKVAITVHRIISIDEQMITFRYKDYADRNRVKEMSISHAEFLRRFEQHILPYRFVKIRHAGYLSTRGRTERIKEILSNLKLPPPMPKIQIPNAMRLQIQTGRDINICPDCKIGILILVSSFIMHNGSLIDVQILKNKGSPITKSP